MAGTVPDRAVTATLWGALCATLLILLPIQNIPGIGRIPVASLITAAVLGVVILKLLVNIGNWQSEITSLKYPLRRHMLIWILFALFSCFYGQWVLESLGKDVLNLTGGSVSYFHASTSRVYQMFLIFFCFEILRGKEITSEFFLKYWLSGACICGFLHIIIAITAEDPLVQRAGPFAEGNFGGLYYIISLFLCLEHRKLIKKDLLSLAALAMIVSGIIISRSSASIVALFFGLLTQQIFAYKSNGWPAKIFTLILVALIAIALVLTGNDFGLSEKLISDSGNESFSKVDRLLSILTAVELFLQKPLLGYGIQSYGFLANDYLIGPVAQVYDWEYRRIPNNIYVEIACEMGLMGIIIFGSLLYRISLIAHKNGKGQAHNLAAGMTSVFVYWLAFPTYSVIFIWAFFAFVCRGDRPKAAGF